MSLPSFPDRQEAPTREEAVNQIISSIAMEELGLSHIINAEGEKIQYALGTIPGVSGPSEPLTMDDLLKLNDSVHKTLSSTMMNQYFLKEKLVGALSSSVLVGPTGPTGPQGPSSIEVASDTVTLDPGESAYVDNTGDDDRVVLQFGIPRGATGAEGMTPTVTVTGTETLEPNNNADVISTPTDTGVELTFQIPRGATGTTELSGIQATLVDDTNLETQILDNEVVPFNQLVNSSGSDITFDPVTSNLTINATGLNSIYLINWWVFAEGSLTSAPVTLSLNVGTNSYVTTAPRTEMQLSGSTLAVVPGGEPTAVSLTNVSGDEISLSVVELRAQINIIGFRAI